MLARAYRIITKEIEKEPSFNLSYDTELVDFLMSTGEYDDCDNSNLKMTVKAIKKALKNKKLWVKEDYRPERLKRDIEGLRDDDWIEYECY